MSVGESASMSVSRTKRAVCVSSVMGVSSREFSTQYHIFAADLAAVPGSK
jgi:hypothetical protein